MEPKDTTTGASEHTIPTVLTVTESIELGRLNVESLNAETTSKGNAIQKVAIILDALESTTKEAMGTKTLTFSDEIDRGAMRKKIMELIKKM